MQDEYIGMFWVVNQELWSKKVPLETFRMKLGNTFNLRSVITYPEAHFKVWINWCRDYGYNPGEENKNHVYFSRFGGSRRRREIRYNNEQQGRQDN